LENLIIQANSIPFKPTITFFSSTLAIAKCQLDMISFLYVKTKQTLQLLVAKLQQTLSKKRKEEKK